METDRFVTRNSAVDDWQALWVVAVQYQASEPRKEWQEENQ